MMNQHASSSFLMEFYKYFPFFLEIRHGNICPEIVFSQKKIQINGRKLKVQKLTSNTTLKSSVEIYVIDDFLTKEECNGLSSAHVNHVKKSKSIGPSIFCFSSVSSFQKYLDEIPGFSYKVSSADFTHGTLCLNETFSDHLKKDFRWSYSTAFYRDESKFSQIYEKRIKEVSSLPSSHGGKFQITSYGVNVGK